MRTRNLPPAARTRPITALTRADERKRTMFGGKVLVGRPGNLGQCGQMRVQNRAGLDASHRLLLTPAAVEIYFG